MVSFKLLPQCWNSEQLRLSKSMYRPFKRLGLLKPSISLSYNPSWFLQPEVFGTSLPGLEPWAKDSGVGLDPWEDLGI